MNVVNASFEILPSPKNSNEILNAIESAGRTCYKSESNITDESAKKFVKGIIKNGHESVLEHQSIIFKTDPITWFKTLLANPKFLSLTCDKGRFIISGNIRALRDFAKTHKYFANILSFLSWEIPVVFDKFVNTKSKKVEILSKKDLLTYNEVLNHYTKSVRVICDRGVTHELVRHRPMSYSQESTRFCCYKNEVTFIKPCFWTNSSNEYNTWATGCNYSEKIYLNLINNGAKPQEARSVLPNSLKTEIVITSNLKQWRHFFKLRAVGEAGRPHPQMLEISIPMLAEFKQIIPKMFDDIIVK